MIKLFELLFFGHIHFWEDYSQIDHVMDDSIIPYKRTMRQRCRKCGRFRQLKM